MALMEINDVISGKEGKAFAVINGNVKELAYLRNIEAIIEKIKTEIKLMGRRGTGNKTTGWKGTGKLNIYYITSIFRQMMIDYIKTGRDIYFDIQIINEDPASASGKQTVILKNCNFDSVIMAKLDGESDTLDEDLNFTFEDVDMPDSFTEIQ